MKNITIRELVNATNGVFVGEESILDENITGVTIDSRKVLEGNVFVAIVGERSDGHDFAALAVQKGAKCVISEKDLDGVPYIKVPSSAKALQDSAAYYRSKLDITIVGVTGSVGKTSTKEMIAAITSEKFSTLKTEGNYNNELGLPLTIFRIEDHHRVAVLEMGISDFGEMHLLASIAKPDICVISNIGYCHLETLGSREGILKAKSEIFDFIDDKANIILNGDDDMLSPLKEIKGIKPYTFGIENQSADVTASNIKNNGLAGVSCDLSFGETSIKVDIPIPGKHMAYNAMAGFLVGHILGMSDNEIVSGISKLLPVTGRNNIIKTEKLIVIDDCYNANPVSMMAAIDVLDGAIGRKVCILGDMFELGEDEVNLHAKVGEHIANKNIDVLICVGELSKNIADKASVNTGLEIHTFDTKDELLADIFTIVKTGDNVLVKASHGMEFDAVVNVLKLAKRRKISAIVAISKNRVIGNDGKIPWRVKGEQRRFRELTTGNYVIMGRKSFAEIGKPLPRRKTILISNSLKVEEHNCTTVSSLSAALDLLKDYDGEIFIAGGSMVYKEAMAIVDRVYLTVIDKEVEGDRFLDPFEDKFKLVDEERIEGEIPFTYYIYDRK